jgi:hypothetical protein
MRASLWRPTTKCSRFRKLRTSVQRPVKKLRVNATGPQHVLQFEADTSRQMLTRSVCMDIRSCPTDVCRETIIRWNKRNLIIWRRGRFTIVVSTVYFRHPNVWCSQVECTCQMLHRIAGLNCFQTTLQSLKHPSKNQLPSGNGMDHTN